MFMPYAFRVVQISVHRLQILTKRFSKKLVLNIFELWWPFSRFVRDSVLIDDFEFSKQNHFTKTESSHKTKKSSVRSNNICLKY